MAAVEASVLVRAQPVAHSALPLSSRDKPVVRIKTNAKEFVSALASASQRSDVTAFDLRAVTSNFDKVRQPWAPQAPVL